MKKIVNKSTFLLLAFLLSGLSLLYWTSNKNFVDNHSAVVYHDHITDQNAPNSFSIIFKNVPTGKGDKKSKKEFEKVEEDEVNHLHKDLSFIDIDASFFCTQIFEDIFFYKTKIIAFTEFGSDNGLFKRYIEFRSLRI